MRAQTVKPFRNRGELIPVGTVLTIRPEDYPRMAHLVEALDPEGMEAEYLYLLARWWDDATEELPDAEIEGMLSRLDTLYRELHRQGCRVPARLPVERNQVQEKQLAL